MKIHCYLKRDDFYTIGFLMIQKVSGVQSFVPLFDVATLQDAITGVSMLNGGDASALRAITKEYLPAPEPLGR